MSGSIRGHKKPTSREQAQPEAKTKNPQRTAIHAVTRRPLSHAAVSLASMMLATGALAQDAGGTLPTIDVVGDPGSSYQSNDQTISRLPATLRDTPQTVNVVPQQVIQEQRITSMEDALRAVPGITFNAGEGGQQGDSPNIRGFTARGDMFRDGIRDPGWYTRDLFSSDRVEVYKGPSAFAFGRGSTGGAINTVTKLPTGAEYVEGLFTGTTGPGYRVEVDANGKKDNATSRIAILAQDVDTPTRDNVYTKRWGVAPSVSIQGNQSKLTISYIFQGEESVPDYGIQYLPQPAYSALTGALTNPGYNGNGTAVTPVPAPRNNWYGIATGPLRDITNVETHIATFKLEHEFDNGLKAVNATRYMVNDRFSRPTAPRSLGDATNTVFASGTGGGIQAPGYPPELMTIGRERRERQTNNTFQINQTDLIAKFTTGWLEHSLVTGMELSRETRNQSRFDLCNQNNADCRTSVFYPNPNGLPIGGAQVAHLPNDTQATTFAVYTSDQIKVNKYLEILGTLRFDRFSSVNNDPDQAVPENRHLQRTDNMWSYRVGAVGHPTENSNVYIAYGNSHNPSAELGTITNASVANLAPEQTGTVEAGVKVDVLDKRLSLTGAVFQIKKTNLRIADPANSTVQILDGVARVNGVELAAAGKVTDKWQVLGGYSYLDSQIMDTSDLSILGRQLPSTPHHNFTLWSTYNVTPKWTVGVGVAYQSAAYVNTTNTAYVPDYWKFDAMTSYKVTPNSTMQLNVYNITDAMYFAQYYQGHAVPASGRYASLSYRVRFNPEMDPFKAPEPAQKSKPKRL